MWSLPIQNQTKPCITEKRRNQANYLIWNSILKFVKKTSMLNPVKSFGYIKWYSSSSPRPVKSPSNSIRRSCQKICSWLRSPKTMLETRKKATFLYVISSPIIHKFFKNFIKQRKKANRAVVFSCGPFPNILKYRDHPRDLPTNSLRLLMYESSGS